MWTNLIGLAMIGMIFFILIFAIRTLFTPQFWDLSLWINPLDGSALTQVGVSDLLYCIAQESAIAQHNMPLLCDLCGISYPPKPDITRPGPSNVPINDATLKREKK